ncbi:MAG: potassium-transporting ATPase subunit KdpC [Acidobacteriaceae bacterium]
MRQNLKTAVLMTIATTVVLGVIYPLVVTGIAQLLFPANANGQLIFQNGGAIGSRIIGQPFTSDAYFHSRPSAAGTGYDAASSGGSNLSPTNSKLIQQVAARVSTEQVGNRSVPIDLVTGSASGLDPDITVAAAEYQVPRIGRARGLHEGILRALIRKHTEGRQFGFLGEPRINVLELNLKLDQLARSQ